MQGYLRSRRTASKRSSSLSTSRHCTRGWKLVSQCSVRKLRGHSMQKRRLSTENITCRRGGGGGFRFFPLKTQKKQKQCELYTDSFLLGVQ